MKKGFLSYPLSILIFSGGREEGEIHTWHVGHAERYSLRLKKYEAAMTAKGDMNMENSIRVRELLQAGLKIGEGRSSGPLTLVPLYGGTPGPHYRLASQAIQDGHLTIAEVPGGSVPELVAENSTKQPVLILDGEHLEGAMQDRVLNTTVLVAAASKTVLPVSCVESGRWHYRDEANFAPSADFSYSRLRQANVESVGANIRAGAGHQSDQSAIWADVSAKHAELGSDSATGAMRDAFANRRGELEKISTEFEEPDAGQTGVVALVGGRPAAVDVFDKPETLEQLWPRLVRGYALDAIGSPESPSQEQAVERFIQTASEGEMTSHDGVGLGTDVVITSESVIGKALWIDGAVVHMSLFPRDRDNTTEPRESRIDSPQRRSARRRIH